jgi:hypothetical protein
LYHRKPLAVGVDRQRDARALGVTIGANKHNPFLSVSQLDTVHAHLHLAAIGFAG